MPENVTRYFAQDKKRINADASKERDSKDAFPFNGEAEVKKFATN